MKPLYKPLALAFPLALLFATTAEARGAVPCSTRQSLDFVTQTQIQGPSGANLSLCVLMETTSVIVPGVNLWRSALSYGLSDSRCTTDAFFDITPEGVALARSIGQVPQDTPGSARLTLIQILGGWWATGGAGRPVRLWDRPQDARGVWRQV